MNVSLQIRSDGSTLAAHHQIVAYDRQTDELAFELPVPGFLDSLAIKIAEAPQDDSEGAFSYGLGSHKVEAFRFLLGLRSDLARFDYFLEPTNNQSTRRNVVDAIEPTSNRVRQSGFRANDKSNPEKDRSDALAAFEKLAARTVARNRKSPRITESELIVPTVRILEDFGGEWVKPSRLVERLTELFKPSGSGADNSAGRNDNYFSQMVRKMISHRDDPESFIRQGLAEYNRQAQGLRITTIGCRLANGLRV
ncbi:MAG: hypothetical protein EXR07_15055 [Acetobacteraceae bacterium]|nr:hypothetical protein [Acetobacteraceae bacterium]